MCADTEYSPTDKPAMIAHHHAATRVLAPHTILLDFLSSHFQAIRYRRADIILSFKRLVLKTISAWKHWRQVVA